jgi:hypothetical protein
MDLQRLDSQQAADSGAIMTILNPVTLEPIVDDDGQEMWIRVAGEDSELYQAATRLVSNRRLQVAFERGRGLRVTAEELEQETLTRLAKCTLAWHLQMNGELLTCTEAEAKKLYKRLPWLREQVDKFIVDRSHFFAPLNGH